MSPQWALSADTFARLLAALHPDREQAGLRYEELRVRLVRVFLWEHAVDPEALADEALTRLARRLDEGEVIQSIPAFLNGIARNLLKEEANRRQRIQPLTDVPAPPADSEIERRHEALEACLRTWDADKRRILLAYYQGDQSARILNRQRLAAQLGLELNALRNRALRLRDRLEACIRRQLDRDTSPRSNTLSGRGPR
jgi:DNA-directed RNA polymerase specialized sigma24 family protein